tara:strand:+ start:1516 stop:2052 length:537 start_codon:yes stop_codon:yes gene_type:complete
MSEFQLDQLDLSNVEADSGESRLRAGRYVCRVDDASLEKVSTDANGRRIQVKFIDNSGLGFISESINIHLPKSEKGTEIGKKQLLTLLTHGGDSVPTSPSIEKIRSVKAVGVNVIDEVYYKDGVQKMGSKVDSWHPYFSPESAMNLGPAPMSPTPSKSANGTGTPSPVPSSTFDDIPF